MAEESSFDIVSKVDMQEMDNAVNQVRKELATRYDFKGTRCGIEFDREAEYPISILADNAMLLRNLKQLVQEKMARRGVSIHVLDYQPEEPAEGDSIRQRVKIRQGIAQEDAKDIMKQIKDLKLKVQASVQGDSIRVRGKKKDDLQLVIQTVKAGKPTLPLQFVNYH